MPTWNRVLLFMLPSPIAVRFGSSQQLIWVFGFSFSAHHFWGGREREAAAWEFAGEANERSRKIDIAVTTRGQGQRCRASPSTYDGNRFQKRATPDELEARAKANSYRREAHREEDSRRDCNKHEDKTKKDQDATLGHCVM